VAEAQIGTVDAYILEEDNLKKLSLRGMDDSNSLLMQVSNLATAELYTMKNINPSINEY